MVERPLIDEKPMARPAVPLAPATNFTVPRLASTSSQPPTPPAAARSAASPAPASSNPGLSSTSSGRGVSSTARRRPRSVSCVAIERRTWSSYSTRAPCTATPPSSTSVRTSHACSGTTAPPAGSSGNRVPSTASITADGEPASASPARHGAGPALAMLTTVSPWSRRLRTTSGAGSGSASSSPPPGIAAKACRQRPNDGSTRPNNRLMSKITSTSDATSDSASGLPRAAPSATA